MKMLFAVLALMCTISVFASSETRFFFFDGSQDSVQLSLQSEETHTEYRYEQRPATCYRREVYYRRECTGGPRPVCRQVPYYRMRPYRCIQTVTIPYEVKDYDVHATVDLRVSDLNVIGASEKFKITLDEDKISLEADGSRKFLIVLKKEGVNIRTSGSMKFIRASYEAELVEAAPVIAALQMPDISLEEDSVLTFTLGPIRVPHLIGHELTVKRAPILGADTVVFSRELTQGEIQIEAQERMSLAKIGLRPLGIDLLTSGRYTLTSRAFFKHQGRLLNASQFNATEISRTLVYKVR